MTEWHKNIFFNDIFQCRIYGWSIGFVPMSLCLSFVIIRVGYLGDYSPSLWGRGQLVGQALLSFLSFLYRLPTNILWIFFLFSFFLFNFVPIIKEIRTINRKILRTKHLLNWPTQFLLFKLTIVTVPRLFVFAHSFLCGGTLIVVSLQTNHCL